MAFLFLAVLSANRTEPIQYTITIQYPVKTLKTWFKIEDYKAWLGTPYK